VPRAIAFSGKRFLRACNGEVNVHRNWNRPTMTRVTRAIHLPSNMGSFIFEMSEGIRALYGDPAGSSYLSTAWNHFEQSISHPHVLTLAAETESGVTGGLLFALRRQRIAQITCVHVLKPFQGQALETALIREAIQILRSQNIEGILCEFVPLGSLNLEDAFEDMGFVLVQRELMRAALNAKELVSQAPDQGRPIGDKDVRDVGKLIAHAYEGHPGRLIHAEVRDNDDAIDFVELALQGGYGAVEREFNRCIERDRQIVAAIIACRVAPDTGFVLQVVTQPLWRRRGLAEQLLRECAGAFREKGAGRIALGVTFDNPARNLYSKLGFNTVTPVEARYWWRV
jgi:ribosomal protein S18 acetylase RimI-like enzyme